MSELKYLTEDDLAYFQDLEKQGKAVIINIDDETLLSLNMSTFFNNLNDQDQIDPNELAKWINQHKKEFKPQYEKSRELSGKNMQLTEEIQKAQGNETPDMQATMPAFQANSAGRPFAPAGNEITALRATNSAQNKEQADIIASAYLNGFDDRIINALLDAGKKGTEEMQRLYNIFANQGNYIP